MKKTELPNRKPTRLTEFDYSTPGAYFVTICTHEKVKILSRIIKITANVVGDGGMNFVHSDRPADYVQTTEWIPKLTGYGEIVDKIINELPAKFNIVIDNYVIMPNHIHLIIRILPDETERVGRDQPLQRSQQMIPRILGYLKMNSSKAIHKITPELNIWQRSFHDHIIRTEREHLEIYKYVENNPFTWENDCFYKN